MKPRRMPKECSHGRLPSSAPLANPYVPFQAENPPKYEAKYGLIRGTMYPGLDLPFQGRVNSKTLSMTPMHELQALSFAMQDLALYLDTHGDDAEALETYRAYQTMYQACREQYQQKYGPLDHKEVDCCKDYRWLDGFWPWEYGHNKEV